MRIIEPIIPRYCCGQGVSHMDMLVLCPVLYKKIKLSLHHHKEVNKYGSDKKRRYD